MIKVETLGMLDVAKVNPVLKSVSDVANYTFITDNGNVYLVCNTIVGDNSYKEDVVIPAGEYLNGYLVKAWEGQKLVIDEKHIAYASEKDYDDIVAGTTILKVNGSGKLEVAAETPTSGIYFKVVEKCRLTEKAVKAIVVVVDANTVAEPGVTTLAELTDVDTTGATSGQVLKFDGTSWKPAADATE